MNKRAGIVVLAGVLALAGCGGDDGGGAGAAAGPASSSAAAGPVSPDSLLACGSRPVNAAAVDVEAGAKETRAPQEQAAEYAKGAGGEFGGQSKVAYESAERADIAFADAKGAVTAVLSYRKDAEQGWLLQEALSCS